MSGLEVLSLAAALVVAVVFLWAGFAKLRAGALWIRQAADMGVGHRLATVVPPVEIVVALAIGSRLIVRWAGLAAAALLTAFSILIAIRLQDASRPPCACFGSRSKRPLGWQDLVRNVGLLGLVALSMLAD